MVGVFCVFKWVAGSGGAIISADHQPLTTANDKTIAADLLSIFSADLLSRSFAVVRGWWSAIVLSFAVVRGWWSENLLRRFAEKICCGDLLSIDHQNDKTIADHQPLTTA